MATKKRLIDANALVIEELLVMDRDYVNEFASGVRKVMNAIRRLPIADAVEVVRCKDCKFFHDKGYCILVTGLNRIKPEDDFCSHGERKDNDR